VAFAAALWFWHLPAAYAWTFRSVPAYWAMHLCLLLTAVLLWEALLDKYNPAASLLASGITATQMTILGAVYTFAGHAFFNVHFGTTDVWGLSPLDDQRLGGLIMWIPPGLALAGVAAWTMATLLSDRAPLVPHSLTTARDEA
jgi:putative membrane protein